MGTVSRLLEFTTADQLAVWCGVSVKTARLWRSGRCKPSRQALRLIALYRDEKVLSGAWAAFTVRGEHLVDPHGSHVTPGQLLAYVWVMQYAGDLAREAGPAAVERFYELLKLA